MLLFTRGWFHHRAGDSHPGASRIKDVLTAQHSTLCSPKRGSKSGSSATAATPARVLQGEGNKQLEKKNIHCPGRELQRKKGEGFALSAQEQSSCGHCRLFILEGFSEVKHRKFPLNCTTRTCCSKIKASTLKLPPECRGCRRAGHKPSFRLSLNDFTSPFHANTSSSACKNTSGALRPQTT